MFFKKTKKTFFFRLLQIILVLSVCFVLIDAAWVEPRLLEIRRFDYSSNQTPEAFVGKKIVFASDFHYGFGFFDYDRLIETIEAEKPDILLLGGDYTDKDPSFSEEILKKVAAIPVPLGIYGVYGNHDNIRKYRGEIKEIMARVGIRDVNNNSFWVESEGQRIKIGGVGDLATDYQKIGNTILDVKTDDLVMLLSHNPDYFQDYPNAKIDLTFSGHNHGGQLGLGFWYPYIPSKYGHKFLSGRIDENNQTLFVSKGIGTTNIPMRFMAKPDILVITLTK